ncbi:MAG: phosphotransferase [Planctomycetota bacterium]|nr:phosphotransferase [Planctomycetota bacterium]
MASPPTLPPTPPAPHLGPVVDDRRAEGARFAAPELGIVLSHYDLGVIRRIREFRRGSRRAPKLRIVAAGGDFLLKRRAPGRDDPNRVAFAHELQLHLGDHGYPVAGLVGTRTDNNSMLQLGQRIYEMFRYVRGVRDDGSSGAAEQAGLALGQLHRLLERYEPGYAPPTGSYHAATGLHAALGQIPQMVAAVEPEQGRTELEERCAALEATYRDAADRADAAGIGQWPKRILHGDWHPGNLLFRDGRIAAVLDFDSARVEPRMIDLANAALQFSMKMTDPDDPEQWPEALNVKRIRSLLQGYDHAAETPISADERRALPWLILEALILESVVPIAATGRFGRLSGAAFLRMIEGKTAWLKPRANKLIQYLEEPR